MRRFWGSTLGTTATLAVILVALLFVGSGAFAPVTTGAVRTSAGPASSSALSHAAARTASAAPAVPAPRAIAHAAPANGSNNTTANFTNITWVELTPQAPNVAPGANVTLTSVALCSNATLTNVACPAGVTYAWANTGASESGALLENNTSSVVFQAGWVPSVANISVVATLNNTSVAANVSSGTNYTVLNVTADGDPSVGVTFGTSFSLYEVLPFTVTWNISVTGNTISSSTTWVTLNVRDISGNCGTQYSDFGLGEPYCPTIVNISEPVASGQTAYSQVINYTVLNATGYASAFGGIFPADNFQVIVWAGDNNSVANVTSGLEHNMYMVFNVPTGVFLSPLPGADISTGNVSFVVRYTGDFIQGAELSVTNSLHQVVYLQAVYAVASGNRTVGSPIPWLAATNGTYTATVNVTTPYGPYLISETLTVLKAGNIIYVNQSSSTTNGLPGGLSPSTMAALLLVIGLIIGLIVALVLGRMMWGAPSQPSSPQPWSPTSSSSTTTTESSSSTTGSSDSSISGDTPKP
jgi:hypothetical protein